MSFDITDSLAPTSDQLDAVELATGPRVFTVESVSKGSAEQPVQVHFVEFPRPWRPSKNMRRILAMCWGTESSGWVGHRVQLYYDPTVTFGRETPGGTRIAALSHIDKPMTVPGIATRGKSATFTVQPLADDAPTPAPTPPTPTAALLDEIGKLADQAGVARKTLADQWAAAHDGQDIREATDVGGLELLRDDLAAQVSK